MTFLSGARSPPAPMATAAASRCRALQGRGLWGAGPGCWGAWHAGWSRTCWTLVLGVRGLTPRLSRALTGSLGHRLVIFPTPPGLATSLLKDTRPALPSAHGFLQSQPGAQAPDPTPFPFATGTEFLLPVSGPAGEAHGQAEATLVAAPSLSSRRATLSLALSPPPDGCSLLTYCVQGRGLVQEPWRPETRKPMVLDPGRL